MDSQEKAPLEEQIVPETVEVAAEEVAERVAEDVAEAVADEVASEVVEEAPERKQYQNKQEVLDRVRELAHGEEAPQKDEVEYLKTAFYKLHIAEREAQLKAYIDGGGDPEQYQIRPDDLEEAFKAEMIIIKEKRQQAFREQEQQKQDNLQRKLDIIEQIKNMVTSPEEANK